MSGLESYDELAERVIADGVLTDPWIDGRPRLRAEPVTISRTLQRELYRVAEGIGAVAGRRRGIVAL